MSLMSVSPKCVRGMLNRAQKLRQIKQDMEQKASAVAGDLPYAIGRKTSTRDMLKNVTTSPEEDPTHETASKVRFF